MSPNTTRKGWWFGFAVERLPRAHWKGRDRSEVVESAWKQVYSIGLRWYWRTEEHSILALKYTCDKQAPYQSLRDWLGQSWLIDVDRWKVVSTQPIATRLVGVVLNDRQEPLQSGYLETWNWANAKHLIYRLGATLTSSLLVKCRILLSGLL